MKIACPARWKSALRNNRLVRGLENPGSSRDCSQSLKRRRTLILLKIWLKAARLELTTTRKTRKSLLLLLLLPLKLLIANPFKLTLEFLLFYLLLEIAPPCSAISLTGKSSLWKFSPARTARKLARPALKAARRLSWKFSGRRSVKFFKFPAE